MVYSPIPTSAAATLCWLTEELDTRAVLGEAAQQTPTRQPSYGIGWKGTILIQVANQNVGQVAGPTDDKSSR